MAVDFEDPKSVAEAAACFCYDDKTWRGVVVYLLQQIAGDTSTAAELAVKACPMCGLSEKQFQQVVALLACQAANAA